MTTVTLRAATELDLSLSFAITEAAMRTYVEATWGGWQPDQQLSWHAQSFDTATHQIVQVDERPCGVLAVREHDTHLQLEKLYLLPEARNSGVGSGLLTQVVERGQRADKPVRLRVLAVNRDAQRFYLRHGFVVTLQTPERLFMERCA